MAERKLQAHGSHPDAPTKKSQRGADDGADDDGKLSMEEMMRQMMAEMRGLRSEVREVTSQTTQAVQTATKAQETAAAATAEILVMKETMITKQELPELVKKVIADTSACSVWPSLGMVAAKGIGKSGGKDAKRLEERARTLVFSNFPEHTQGDDMIRMIEAQLADVSANVEEVFAYSKTGTRAAAKFKTADGMWAFMVNNKGRHNYTYEGRRIYVRAGAGGGDGNNEEDLKERAVRKSVRAMIEREGGDGNSVKQRIDAKYRQGRIWWKHADSKWELVAQWNAADKKMEMMGSMSSLQGDVDKLLQ
jgi:hypothetical protein